MISLYEKGVLMYLINGIFNLILLLLAAAILKAWGAILIFILFAGFFTIVVNSNKYPKLNEFFDAVF